MLTDEDIDSCIKSADRNSGVYRKVSWHVHLARAIEAAYEAKLWEQEPIAWLYDNEYDVPKASTLDPKHYGYGGTSEKVPLYKNPAPIPEGIQDFIYKFKRHVGGDGEFWLHELEDFYVNMVARSE